jgi:hypothetical protein
VRLVSPLLFGFEGVGGVGDSTIPGFDFLREKILFKPDCEDLLSRIGVLSCFAGTGGAVCSTGGGESGGEEGNSWLYRASICSCKRRSQSPGALSMHRVCAMKLQCWQRTARPFTAVSHTRQRTAIRGSVYVGQAPHGRLPWLKWVFTNVCCVPETVPLPSGEARGDFMSLDILLGNGVCCLSGDSLPMAWLAYGRFRSAR